MANDNVVWAAVGFCVLGLAVICIMIGLSCYNEFSKPDLTICGSIGICICCGLACKYLLSSQYFSKTVYLLYSINTTADKPLTEFKIDANYGLVKTVYL